MDKNNRIFQNKTTMILLSLFCCILWASAFPCIKIGYKLFGIESADTCSQILFAGCRFSLAGILVLIMGIALNKKFPKPNKASLGKILKLSLMQTVIQYIFFYMSMAYTSGVKGSIISSSNVFFSILLSCTIFKMEKIQSQKLIGCLIGFGGVIIVNLSGSSLGAFSPIGDTAMIISSLANAIAAIMIKKYSEDNEPILLNAYQFLIGGIFLIITALLLGGSLHPQNVGAILLILYMAFISAGAYTLWSILLKYNPVSKVTIFGFSTPIFGVILSAIILKESNIFSLQTAIALIMVCFGIIAVNYEKRTETLNKTNNELNN